MVNIGATFVLSILTWYTLYRYFLHPNAFYTDLLIVHFSILSFFSVFTTVVIYIGSLVRSKVNISTIRYPFFLKKRA